MSLKRTSNDYFKSCELHVPCLGSILMPMFYQIFQLLMYENTRKVITLQELSYTTSQMMDVNPWDYKPDTDHTKIGKLDRIQCISISLAV